MLYFFYEDQRGDGYVRIHQARCGHCYRGVTLQARAGYESGYSWWHGPYESYEHALAEAERMELPVVRCQACLGVAPGGDR